MKFFTLTILIAFHLLTTETVCSQTCFPTGLNGAVVNLSCTQTCTNFNFQIPHLKTTSAYVINTVPYTPFPYLRAGAQEDPNLYDDDTYSTLVSLPFSFCFYDSTFNQAVVGSNGIVTFDPLNAGCANAYTINNTIPYAGGTRCSGISPDYYPKASIMGFFSDIDPTLTEGPSDRKISWYVDGVAPCRKFVVSYYHVGTFGTLCGLSVDSSNTFQIVMYESTGLIDVYIQNKSCFSSTNAPGYAILGIQNWNQNQAVAAPGKNKTLWTSQNEGYRFTPNGGTSRFVSSELFTLGGTLVAAADTSTSVAGLLDVSFPNICPGATTQYVIKTVLNSCTTGAQLISYDTVSVVQINQLTATATSTPSTCGANVGTITATVTGGVGTPPFTYSLTPTGATNNTGIFPGLAAGNYNISIVDAASCAVTITETVDAVSSLGGTAVTTGTACTGVNNGTITLTPQGNPPYTFTLTGPGGPITQSSPLFTNLNSGTYNATYTDGSICAGTISNIVVASGGTLSATETHTNSTCNGANDGTITAVPNVPGSYSYTLNPGAIATNSTGVFTGLTPATYSVAFTNTVTGCSGNITGITIAQGSTIPATWIRTNETCPGANDGTIQITPSAAGVYTYTLTPGNVTNSTGLFVGLSPGIFYNVVFTNTTSGCGGQMTNLFVQAATSVINATETHTNATCPGVNDGTITITVVPAGAYTYTLTPGNVTNTTGIFTGLPGGTYSVTFENATGCGNTLGNIVVGPGAAGGTTTATTTSAVCTGVNNGSITVVPPATGGPFVYTLTPGPIVQNNNPVFTNLAPGTYNITYSTAAGCGGTVSPAPVVTAQASPTTTATATATECAAASTGTVTVTPPATGGPFSYTLNPGGITQANPLFTGLAAGTYTVSFTTAAGCTGTVPVNPVVTALATQTTTAVATAAACPGVNNGTVTVTPPAAGGPFTYTLNPGNITNNTGAFTGLSAGTYNVTFTTAAGCSGTVLPNPVVTAGAAPTTTATATNTTCAGVNDGIVTVTPPTGGGIVTYTLTPGGLTNTTGIFTGLAANTYTVTFTTTLGCAGTVPVNPVVQVGTSLTTTASASSTTCPGVDDGVVTINPLPNGAPFVYTLNPGGLTNSTGIFPNLAAGSYTITFVTAGGCLGTVPVNPVVTVGTAPTTTATASNTTCPGVDDGTITVTPPAVGGPFTYTINPGAITNSTGIFTGLAADTYTVTFTTSQGCNGTVAANQVIAVGAAPTTTATVTNTTCPGVDDGVITVTPPTGAGPFNYTLNPGAVTNPTGVFPNLAPGTYTVTFTTPLGCVGSVTNTLTVQAGPAPVGTVTVVDPPCANINDGTITINPAIVGVYTYTLNPGLPTEVVQVNNPLFTGLAPGTYTYSFENTIGCVGSGTTTLDGNTPLAATVSLTQPLCNADANGVITISASGGVGPYQYALSPFSNFQNGTFNGLTSGTYTIRIRDNVGCTKDTTVNLGQPTVLTASASSTAGTCNGNDGTIVVTGNGGTTAYEFSIDGGATYQPGGTFTVSGGSYPDIRVRDANGCVANTSETVTLIDDMSALYIGNDTTICAEQSIVFQPQVSTQASVFVWTTYPDTTQVITLDDDSIRNPTATPLDTINYILYAQWGVCSRVDTILVNVLRKPVPYAGADTAVCFDNTVAVLHGSASNLSGTVNFSWSDTTNLATPDSSVTVATPPITESFYLTVTDNYGCNFSVTDTVVVTVQPPVPAFAGNDTIAVLGQPHQLLGAGGVQYSWTPTAPLNFSNVSNPLATLTHDQLFVVTVTDVAGCVGTDEVFVQALQGPRYYVPNAFTPNNDGLNDIFRVIPPGISYTEYFRVFNRYGELVFETNQWLKGWDGTFRGKAQPMGNYVWSVKGVDKFGKVIELQGTVMLIR